MSTEVKIQNVTTTSDKPLLQLTDAAIKHIKRHLQKHRNYSSVRFSTKAAGCSGMLYVVDFIENPTENDQAVIVDNDLTVYVASKSIPFIRACTVDYVKDAAKLSYAWQFTNPNARANCGCGESFTV